MTLLDIADPRPWHFDSDASIIIAVVATTVVLALCAFFIIRYRKTH